MFPDLKDTDEEFLNGAVRSLYQIFERKYDGTAAMISIKDGKLTIYGRGILKDGSQQDYTEKFPELRDEIIKGWFDDCEVLGEIVVFEDHDQESFNMLQSRTNRTTDIEKYAEKYPATFIAFDIKSYGGKNLEDVPFRHRRRMLADLIPKIPFVMIIKQYDTPIDKSSLIIQMKENNFEGIVIKSGGANWGKQQYKFKPVLTEDVFWDGEFVPGKGKNEGLVGSLICYQYVNGSKMEVAKVGGGINDILRRELTRMVNEKLITKDKPQTIEIQAHELLKSGKMRYPQFIRFRSDKSAKQCTRILQVNIDNNSDLNKWI